METITPNSTNERGQRTEDSTSKTEEGLPTTSLSSFSEFQMAEANRRLELVEAYAQLLQGGCTPGAAAKQLGQSRVTIWRWEQRYAQSGYQGLIPETHKRGRKSKAEKLGLTPEIVAQVKGLNSDLESNTAAWRLYAHSDRCPEQLAEEILDPTKCSKHALPPSLRQATKLDDNVKLAHRGRRALDLGGMWIPRRMDILPGDIFTADDTTPIWGWWVPWVECKEYPFGVKLLQGQFLPVMDVASQCVICFVLIAREKSSYRAADIWQLFGHTFEQAGLPRLGWQLERGSWEANMIRGEVVEYRDGEVTQSRRLGGLRALPSNWTVWHQEKWPAKQFPKTLQTYTSYLPKSKTIEAAFNRMQTLEGTIWGCLGRDQMRNPYEKAKKQFQACQRGAADPRQHFLSQTEMINRLREILNYMNSEPMEGEVFKGIPRQLFDQAVQQFPLFRLPEDQRYLYRCDWKIVTITQGWARIRLTDEMTGNRYSLFYVNPVSFATLEGQPVVVYYDRENFEKPAQIHSGRTGEFICEANYFDRKGSFLDGDLSGQDIRKAWRNAVMSGYGTLVANAPSRQVPAEIAARRAEAAKQTSRTPTAPVQAAREVEKERKARISAEPDDYTSLDGPVTTRPRAKESGWAVDMAELEQL